MREPVPIVVPHTDLAAENAAVRAENTHLKAMIGEMQATVATLRRQVESQQAHIHRLVKLTFGRGGERVEGPTLFDTLTPPAATPAAVAPAAATPDVVVRRKGHGRKAKPADLPRRRVDLDVSAAEKTCACCGTAKIRIGATVTERLDYQPSSLFVNEFVRPTYACRPCEAAGRDPQFAKPAAPPEPLPKSGVGAGLLAHVIVSKFVDHLPLHRQEAILARHGWDVRRSTLCDHLHKCGLLLKPLRDLMRDRLRQSFALHADETPLVLLRPKRTAYAWVYLGDAANPFTLFDLTPGRRDEFPQTFLAGYRGFVHADAYAGYDKVHGLVRHVGCWMHARRYFVDAEASDPRAVEALAFIRTLYAVEKEIKDERTRHGDAFPDADAVNRRQARAGPVLAAFAKWLETQHRTALPQSLFGQAVTYARNQWPTLTRYVHDARLAIDNGAAERALRPLCVGRGNWLHIGGDTGLATAGVLLSLCASAARHRLNPWSYLTDVLNRLATRPAAADLPALLPDAWATRHRPA